MAAFESVLYRLLGSRIFPEFSGSFLTFLVLVEAYFCELLFGVLLPRIGNLVEPFFSTSLLVSVEVSRRKLSLLQQS